MIKVLITGGNGQLGQSFRYWSSEFKDFKFSFKDLPELDLTKSSQIKNYLEKNNINYVINCAAYTYVDKAEKETKKAEELNVGAVGMLCKFAKKYKFRLIHFSTDYVFDGTKNKPYKETEIHSPINVYGITKARGESLILDSKIDAWIIRTSWLFSPYGKNFVTNIFSSLHNMKKLNVIDDQVGAPTYAIDLAKLTLEAIKIGNFGVGVKIYHFTNKGSSTWYNLAMKIKQEINSECQIHPIETSSYPSKARRPKYSVLSCGKMEKDFNLNIRSWELAMKHCINKILSKDV